jgi:outer membrane biosynthesis protein TonB
MKNLKIYWLILLITFAVSFALPVNAQIKKIRKKSKVTKKKVVRKTVTPKMAVKIGTENTTPADSDMPVRPVKISSDNYNSTGSDGPTRDTGDSSAPPRAVKMGSNNGSPCINVKEGLVTGKISSVSGGVVNGKATSLPKPPYPVAAKAVKASGSVSIQVLIDEEGNVVSANATSGHPLLRAVSEKAAREAKFFPTELCGQRVKVSGIITYNFVAQ